MLAIVSVQPPSGNLLARAAIHMGTQIESALSKSERGVFSNVSRISSQTTSGSGFCNEFDILEGKKHFFKKRNNWKNYFGKTEFTFEQQTTALNKGINIKRPVSNRGRNTTSQMDFTIVALKGIKETNCQFWGKNTGTGLKSTWPSLGQWAQKVQNDEPVLHKNNSAPLPIIQMTDNSPADSCQTVSDIVMQENGPSITRIFPTLDGQCPASVHYGGRKHFQVARFMYVIVNNCLYAPTCGHSGLQFSVFVHWNRTKQK